MGRHSGCNIKSLNRLWVRSVVTHPEVASARQSMAEYSASSSVTSSSNMAVAGSSMRTEPS